jgi:hypothetical protein
MGRFHFSGNRVYQDLPKIPAAKRKKTMRHATKNEITQTNAKSNPRARQFKLYPKLPLAALNKLKEGS